MINYKPQRIRKAIISAAGLGLDFMPATKASPKEMLPIVYKPTIQYVIEEALASGIDEILIISGFNKRAIEDYFESDYELEKYLVKHCKEELLKIVKDLERINIKFVRQKEAKGLGDAILCARRFIGYEPFALLLGDDVVYNDEYPCLKQMIDVYNATGGSVLGCQTVSQEKMSSYGIVDSVSTDNERIFKVKDIVEKPAVEESPSRIAVLGRYVITPEIFRILEHTEPGRSGEIQLTDALKVLALQKDIYAYDILGRHYDVGNKQGYLEAQVEYALRRNDLAGKFRAYLKDLTQSNL